MDRNGDLSNRSAPRVVFVWENLLASLDPRDAKAEERLLKRKKWARALELWEESPVARNVLLDTLWRKNMPVDLLCLHPNPFGQRLWDRLERTAYPASRMYCHGPVDFSHQLSYMPDVAYVFHAEDNDFLFGGKGRRVNNILEVMSLLPNYG